MAQIMGPCRPLAGALCSTFLSVLIIGILIRTTSAVTGLVTVDLQLWQERSFSGSSIKFNVTDKFFDGVTPAVTNIIDLAVVKYRIPAPARNATPAKNTTSDHNGTSTHNTTLPRNSTASARRNATRYYVGDSARSLMLNFTCQNLEGGTCFDLISNISIVLYGFPLYKSNGGRRAVFNITKPSNCFSNSTCGQAWPNLPGMDRTASAISFLFNYPNYTFGPVPNASKASVPPMYPPPRNQTSSSKPVYPSNSSALNGTSSPSDSSPDLSNETLSATSTQTSSNSSTDTKNTTQPSSSPSPAATSKGQDLEPTQQSSSPLQSPPPYSSSSYTAPPLEPSSMKPMPLELPEAQRPASAASPGVNYLDEPHPPAPASSPTDLTSPTDLSSPSASPSTSSPSTSESQSPPPPMPPFPPENSFQTTQN